MQFNPILDYALAVFFLLLLAFLVKWMVEAKLNRYACMQRSGKKG